MLYLKYKYVLNFIDMSKGRKNPRYYVQNKVFFSKTININIYIQFVLFYSVRIYLIMGSTELEHKITNCLYRIFSIDSTKCMLLVGLFLFNTLKEKKL